MVRRVTVADRQIYLDLADAFYHSEAVLHPISKKNITAAFDEMVHSDCYLEGYIFEEDNIPAGFGLIAKTFSQEAGGLVIWVEDLFVLPQYRSKGLAAKFFEHLFAVHAGAKRFRLEVTRDNRAAALYERMGFLRLDYQSMVLERCFAEDRE